MPIAQTKQTKLYYEAQGDSNAPSIIMIMGLGTQMIAWPPTLRRYLVDAGFRVICFDNRDVGLSAKHGHEIPNILHHLAAFRLGIHLTTPYTLNDMASDTVDLMNHLGIEQAHIIGASMGGMIAQIIAADHPAHVSSLTSIMSSSGNRKLPMPRKRVVHRLLKRPQQKDKETYIEHSLKTYRMIESPIYPTSNEEIRAYVEAAYDRAHYPRGYLRQLAAILANGDRTPLLQRISCPTLVIHGKDDPLSPVQGGIHTALQIKNAKLELIDGMGHNLPAQLVTKIGGLIVNHCELAKS